MDFSRNGDADDVGADDHDDGDEGGQRVVDDE